MKCLYMCCTLLVGVLLLPGAASAQAISGVVTDSSGGVMPGVTVEASSPALIERSRTAVTDAAGRYSIVSLRPGDYAVTFALDGFTTQKREGITLTSDFTASVNVQMAVGGREEVVTVIADSPLVDVASVSKAQTISTPMLDSLPLGNRTIQDVLSTVPGTGSTIFGTNTYRGSEDTLTTVDGNRTVWLGGPGPGASTQTLSVEAYQEFTVSTGIDNLDTPTPGMRINVVPKDGGNQFRGSAFVLYSGEGWSGNNIPDKYKAAPFNFVEPADEVLALDINPTFGGPIKRDKLWFQNTFHHKQNDAHVLGLFNDANPNPFIYTPDRSSQPVAQQTSNGGGTRLTWQATARDKFAGFFDDEYAHWGNFFATAGASPESATNYYSPHSRNFGVKWTRPHTGRLLFEGGMSSYRLDLFNDLREPMLAWSTRRGSAEPDFTEPPIPGPEDLAIVMRSGFFNQFGIGTQPAGGFTGSGSSSSISKTWTANMAVSYITGSHNFKAGVTFLYGTDLSENRDIADVSLIVDAAGAPTQITASMPASRKNTVDGDWGFYAQDAWTIQRLTVKGGVRLDWLKTSYPDQVLPASVWLPTQQNCANNPGFCGRDVLDWKDLSPRAGVVYDVFGNGKTAVRGGVARYISGETIATTNANNPLSGLVRTTSGNWTDLDGNRSIYSSSGAIQRGEINRGLPYAGGFQDPAFGTAQLTTAYDPDVLSGFGKRGYTWEYDFGIDHEILPRMSLSLVYYNRWQGNQLATNNRSLGLSDYDPFCLVAPTDAGLGSASGSQICGLYDLKPFSAFKVADNLVTFADNLGTGDGYENINRGYNLTVSTRLPRGAFISGGLDIRKAITDRCSFPVANTGFFVENLTETPEDRFCRNESAFNTGARLNGSYVLPYGVMVAVAYQAVRGPNLLATWTATNADIAAAAAANVPTRLGRNFSSFFGQRSVVLIEPNTEYLPYRHNFDMRLSKIFNVAGYRLTGGVDLYNAFNSAGINTIRTAFPAVDWGQATGIVGPRQLRLSATVSF